MIQTLQNKPGKTGQNMMENARNMMENARITKSNGAGHPKQDLRPSGPNRLRPASTYRSGLVTSLTLVTFILTMVTAIPRSEAGIGRVVLRIAKKLGRRTGRIAGRSKPRPLGTLLRNSGRFSKSKVVVSDLSKTEARAFQTLARRYGTQNAKMMLKTHGQDLLRFTSKYGDEGMATLGKLSARAQALVIREPARYLSIAKRAGPAALELEAKTPGMLAPAMKRLTRDELKFVAKLPARDTPRIIGLAARTKTPQATRVLMETYERATPTQRTQFLEGLTKTARVTSLTSKQIIALGLATGILTISAGGAVGLGKMGTAGVIRAKAERIAAEKDPAGFWTYKEKTAGGLFRQAWHWVGERLGWVVSGGGFLILVFFFLFLLKHAQRLHLLPKYWLRRHRSSPKRQASKPPKTGNHPAPSATQNG